MKIYSLLALMLFSLNSIAGEYVSECGSIQLKTDRGGMTLELTKVSDVFGKGPYAHKVFLNNGYGSEATVDGLSLKLLSTRFIENYTNAQGTHLIVYSAQFMVTANETIDRVTSSEGQVSKLKFKEASTVCTDYYKP